MPKLEGPDVSIEISLKEYGIAWKIGEAETRFYYGTVHNGSEYTQFESMSLENDLDMHDEYEWADLLEVANFAGVILKDWEKMPLTEKIQGMIGYYGTEIVFAPTIGNGETYKEVTAKEVE